MAINSIFDDYKILETNICDNLCQVDFFDNSVSDLNFMHVNRRSIYQNFDQFLVYLESLNYENITQKLNGELWGDVLQENNVELCTEAFINRLKDIILKATITRPIPNKKKKLKPWITGGLLISIRNRNLLKRECALNPSNFVVFNRYQKYRKFLSKLIKKVKYNYYKYLAQKNLDNPRKLWNVLREATNDQESKPEIKCITTKTNSEITDKKEVADEFNNYFCNIGKKLASEITRGTWRNEVREKKGNESLFLCPVTNDDVIREINCLKNGIKGGEDNISSNIIKKYKEKLSIPLKHIINLVFGTESVINYGFVVWGNTSLTTLSKLQVAQKWIIKIMLFKQKRYSSELVFRDSKILNLEQLYLKSLIRFMMKYDLYKEYLQHGQNTRSAAHANAMVVYVRLLIVFMFILFDPKVDPTWVVVFGFGNATAFWIIKALRKLQCDK
ncbi:unnamed protein product [Acanthoscelides obtectus]|uniref:Uncharacterized protein n=1 Tax=Acanthoscelides obtectus TaxID=200917 RepID=A0A9P0P1X6_ACAOB|nr:unnamed protein product [Acanthoscelides obtectus]CAK1646186.1 hypothetical protein AOBTE_LOCUS14504 [Acanthoscelides obtectus]